MHKPVLLHEVLEGLELESGETLLDGTLGAGGHSLAALKKAGDIRVIALDRDPEAIEKLRTLDTPITLVNESFRNLDKVLQDLGVEEVDAILLDLGLSSDQFDDSGRGFTFQKNEPLDMRMGKEGATAADILNTFSESALELILRGFGEESYSKRIAHEIVEIREAKPFKTTFDLVAAVDRVKRRSFRDKIHPATKTFQALRIATNDELTALEEGLEKGFKALSKEGRFAIIAFHSLEDRIVKNYFRDKAHAGEAELITKKPITPTDEEVASNPRSRSAKLRILKKI